MNNFNKDIEKLGSWSGSIEITLDNTEPEFVKEFLDNEVCPVSRDAVEQAILNGDSFSIGCLNSDSPTAEYVKEEIVEYGNTYSLGNDINFDLLYETILDGKEVGFDDLSDETVEHIVNEMIGDYHSGEICETHHMEYSVDVSNMDFQSINDKNDYVIGVVSISDQFGNNETCVFSYDTEEDILEFAKYSQPSFLDHSVVEISLPDMIKDNIEELNDIVICEIDDFITEKETSLDEKLAAAEEKAESQETSDKDIKSKNDLEM